MDVSSLSILFCVAVQLGYLLVIPKTEVEGGEQWLTEMGLSLVVRRSLTVLPPTVRNDVIPV